MIKIDVTELSYPLFRQLYSLNMRDKGRMRDALVEHRLTKGATCYIIGDVAAWAIVRMEEYRKEGRVIHRRTADFYVRQSLRKQGLGRILVDAVKKKHPKIVVRQHNEGSKEFFRRTLWNDKNW